MRPSDSKLPRDIEYDIRKDLGRQAWPEKLDDMDIQLCSLIGQCHGSHVLEHKRLGLTTEAFDESLAWKYTHTIFAIR